MVQNPPRDTQRIVPYLHYEDGAAAIEYLCKTFGFEEHLAVKRGDGTLMHGTVGYQGNVVMLGTPLDESGKPRRVSGAERHSTVMCYVDDVDAHYARARDAGAEIRAALETQGYGDRSYSAVDPEGHVWHFATHVADA